MVTFGSTLVGELLTYVYIHAVSAFYALKHYSADSFFTDFKQCYQGLYPVQVCLHHKALFQAIHSGQSSTKAGQMWQESCSSLRAWTRNLCSCIPCSSFSAVLGVAPLVLCLLDIYMFCICIYIYIYIFLGF